MDTPQEMFIQRHEPGDNVQCNAAFKPKEPLRKVRSIDNLALKLANCKSDPLPLDIIENETSNTNEESENVLFQTFYSKKADINNRYDEKRTESERGGNNLSTIIQEIYERSLQRDKKLDDKIKTLAQVVTKTIVESEVANSKNSNRGPNTNEKYHTALDIDNSIDTSYRPETVDDYTSGNGDLSTDNASQADVFSIHIKNETTILDEREQSVIASDSNMNDTISVSEDLGIDEEKYEYFSRNVKLFVTRDVPLLKEKGAHISKDIDMDITENQQQSDMSSSDQSPKVLGKKVQANIRKFGSEKPFECDICNRTFSQNGHLNRHMRIHTGDKPFQCDVCGKEFSQSGDKRRHERTHSSFRPYQCFICDKEFNQSGHLQRHLRVHAGHILYNDGQFDKELTRKKYTEEKEAAKDKTKKCPLCDKIFLKKYLLDRHVRSHTGETPYKCEECGKGFTRKDRLQTHARIHTGEKPYCCQQCGKGFNQSSHLKTHIRIHTGDRPYKCGICGRGFAQSHDRKKHVRVHTGERPYICQLCGKDFNDNSQLWRHARTHDDIDKLEGTSFKCRICDNEYEYSSQLLQHMKDHTDVGNQMSVPDVIGFQNDSEMEAVRLAAEALLKTTMASTGNDDHMSPIESGLTVDAGQGHSSSFIETDVTIKAEQLYDPTDESDESMEPKWDGQMYISENMTP